MKLLTTRRRALEGLLTSAALFVAACADPAAAAAPEPRALAVPEPRALAVPQDPSAPPAAGPAAQPAPAARGPFPKPEAEAFVCLVDGTFLAGAVEKSDETIGFTGPDGKRRDIPKPEVSLAVAGGKTVYRGDEAGIHAAWRGWLRETHLARIPGGKFDASAAAGRDAYVADLLAAADRLAKRKMVYAAAGLLADAIDAGAWNDDMQTRCLEWELDQVPEFPFSPEDAERARLFAVWAREIVPLGGRFVLKKEATSIPLPTHWTEDVVAVRTRNLLVRSRVTEPDLVTTCLKQGEATVRVLESLLGMPERGNDEPLEIRLYRDRKEYLEDVSGKRAMLWSAGYFSPGEGVSRFYFLVNEQTGKLDGLALDEFFRVLSHELTHHWIERRHHRGGRRYEKQPGYWIVEGFASFVDDHCLTFQSGKATFDDARAEGITTTQQMRQMSLLLPMSRLVDLSQSEFHLLPQQQIGAFYEQSASLVFLMMNRRGADGRKRLLDYMRKHYAGDLWAMPPSDPFGRKEVKLEEGKPVLESWKILGFATSAELENAFHAFLEKP